MCDVKMTTRNEANGPLSFSVILASVVCVANHIYSVTDKERNVVTLYH